MNPNPKLFYAIAAILGGPAVGVASTATDIATYTDAISEIVVTAQRRTENMQDVPITIQAFMRGFSLPPYAVYIGQLGN